MSSIFQGKNGLGRGKQPWLDARLGVKDAWSRVPISNQINKEVLLRDQNF